MFFDKWLVLDNLPAKADAICCLSYCLSWDKTRLVKQGLCCVNKAFDLYNQGCAPLIILSNSYKHYWQLEASLKNKIAVRAGIPEPEHSIYHLQAVNNTYEEASQIKSILEKQCAKSLILIADQWHMKRALDAFQRLMPNIKIYPISVKPEKYEMAREPSIIKSVRSRFKILWIVWNIFFYYLNSLFLRNRP